MRSYLYRLNPLWSTGSFQCIQREFVSFDGTYLSSFHHCSSWNDEKSNLVILENMESCEELEQITGAEVILHKARGNLICSTYNIHPKSHNSRDIYLMLFIFFLFLSINLMKMLPIGCWNDSKILLKATAIITVMMFQVSSHY